jgi:acyl-CoA synthetase (AMP-forming)/AMP-acid ligase II
MIRTDLIRPIGTLLERHATERPDQVAFEDSSGAAITYAAMATRTATLAGHLQELGIESGDRVAILLPNSVDWVLSCVATLRTAAVSVPISHDATEAEIRYRLEDAGCKAIVVSRWHLPLLQSVRAELPLLQQVIVAGTDDPTELQSSEHSLAHLTRHPARSNPRDPQDLLATAFLVYTSGTTGRPKGVMLSLHSMLWVTAACWAPIAGFDATDVMLSPLPLFHSYALNLCVLSVIAVGASQYLLQKFSTQDVIARLNTGRYTLMPGVPTMFHYLLEAHKESNGASAQGVRYFISAGAILPAALNRDFETAFGVPLLDGYGITETSTMVTMNWPGPTRVMGSCGLPLPGVATRIVDLRGEDVPLGAEGELIVRGPNVMQGYLNKPEDTAKALADGWYRTGDLARSDLNGFLTITGRLKELIIRGGQNIAPAEVEDALLAHSDVLECAVLGMPHPHLGEVPVACVVVRSGRNLDSEGLRQHVGTLLSAYKVPAVVHQVDAIPRTGSGKIMRFKLREALSG